MDKGVQARLEDLRNAAEARQVAHGFPTPLSEERIPVKNRDYIKDNLSFLLRVSLHTSDMSGRVQTERLPEAETRHSWDLLCAFVASFRSSGDKTTSFQ